MVKNGIERLVEVERLAYSPLANFASTSLPKTESGVLVGCRAQPKRCDGISSELALAAGPDPSNTDAHY